MRKQAKSESNSLLSSRRCTACARTNARPCARNTGATVELQWLHDERELIGPCLSEVLEDVDRATEVRVHRGWNGVAGRFPLAH